LWQKCDAISHKAPSYIKLLCGIAAGMRGGSNGIGYEKANSGDREAQRLEKIMLYSELLSFHWVLLYIDRSYLGGPSKCVSQ
jgi:hypothetical protein